MTLVECYPLSVPQVPHCKFRLNQRSSGHVSRSPWVLWRCLGAASDARVVLEQPPSGHLPPCSFQGKSVIQESLVLLTPQEIVWKGIEQKCSLSQLTLMLRTNTVMIILPCEEKALGSESHAAAWRESLGSEGTELLVGARPGPGPAGGRKCFMRNVTPPKSSGIMSSSVWGIRTPALWERRKVPESQRLRNIQVLYLCVPKAQITIRLAEECLNLFFKSRLQTYLAGGGLPCNPCLDILIELKGCVYVILCVRLYLAFPFWCLLFITPCCGQC